MGSGLPVGAAVMELAHTGPDPLRAVLARFAILAPALGVVPALEAIRDEIADPTTDRVIEVLIVAHEIGGRVVPGVLEDLAAAVEVEEPEEVTESLKLDRKLPRTGARPAEA